MKKICCLLLLLVGSFIASAQTDSRIFYSQLMVVISDLEKNFEYLKGEEITKQHGVSFYETIRSLEGTKDNMIVIDSATSQYQAIIIDSTSEEGAKLILNSWKNKLTDALTGMFSSATEFRSEKNADTSGYQFASEKTVILLLQHKQEHERYWINLVIKPKS